MTTVYGDRICQRCKGLCHDESWRTRSGIRHKYWCCESHLKADYLNRLQKRCQALGVHRWQDITLSEGDIRFIHDMYQQVDVRN